MFDLNLQAHLILLIDRGRSKLKPDHSSLADAAEFRPTRWSVVLLSAQSEAPGSRAALAALCGLYWYPLYAFIRRRGYNPEDAQDLTQGFFLHLLDHKALAEVDPLKGKFRSFLLASLQNYLSKELDRARCLKRGGKMEFFPLDAKNAEDRYRLEPTDYLTAEKIFDARWALTLLDEAMSLLSAEYAGRGEHGNTRSAETLFTALSIAKHCRRTNKWPISSGLASAQSRCLFIACAKGTRHFCARRSPVRFQIQER